MLTIILSWGLVSCQDRLEASKPQTGKSIPQGTGQITEVAPPKVIQQLRPKLDKYQPQVAIISPSLNEVLTDTTVEIKLQVQDLPIFKDKELGMGPHLHLILDNEPYQAVYNVDSPIVLSDLEPGTHTLRVFASRPWHESFKNEGAYAQTSFHVFTQTDKNNPNPSLPLLTYSRPKGEYGAEPILLDFYLTNAPLHLVAQEDNQDELADWRIKVTVNGQSFVLNKWQPIYLQGFEPGKNWIQLEFLNEQGNAVENAFNNTVRLITYSPKGQDTLSKLVRGELSAEVAQKMVNPAYTAPIKPIPTPSEPEIPEVEETPTPKPTLPRQEEEAPVVPSPEEEATLEKEEEIETEQPQPEISPAPETPVTPTPEPAEEKQGSPALRNLFKRFRRPEATPTPVPEEVEPSTLEPETEAIEAEETPETTEVEILPVESQPESLPVEEEETESVTEPPQAKKTLLERFRRPQATPSPSPVEPEVDSIPSEPPVSESEEILEAGEKQSLSDETPPTLPEIVEEPVGEKSESQVEIEEKVLPTSPGGI